jgi:acylphosphatase
MDNTLAKQHNDCMAICKHVRYTGRVQGVGFRYTAQRVAEEFPISGYVGNLRDGTVEVVVEGSPEDVDSFLAALARQMAGYIEETVVQEQPCSGYSSFRVRY